MPTRRLLSGWTKRASISLPLLAGEIWVDNAFLNFKKLPGVPKLSLKVGRFDMITNEGFGFFTGSEGAGPRTPSSPEFGRTIKLGNRTSRCWPYISPEMTFSLLSTDRTSRLTFLRL